MQKKCKDIRSKAEISVEISRSVVDVLGRKRKRKKEWVAGYLYLSGASNKVVLVLRC